MYSKSTTNWGLTFVIIIYLVNLKAGFLECGNKNANTYKYILYSLRRDGISLNLFQQKSIKCTFFKKKATIEIDTKTKYFWLKNCKILNEKYLFIESSSIINSG